MRFSKRHITADWILLLSIFLIPLGIYLISLPTNVVLEDDGFFILAGYTKGIAHPPGYPLYTLISYYFSFLPLGNIAQRFHILSAVFAAFSCCFLWCVANRIIRDKTIATMVALLYAFSSTFWSQAIIAEVYSLNIFFISGLLLLSLKYLDSDTVNGKLLIFITLTYSLSLTNHWPLIMLSTPMFIAILWPKIGQIARSLYFCIPFFLIGLSPYLWMYLNAQTNPDITFFGKIDNISELMAYIRREMYSGADQSNTANWKDKIGFLSFVLNQSMSQAGYLAGILSICGFFYQFRLLAKNLICGLTLGYAGSAFILVYLLGFDYDYLHKQIFKVYPLPAYLVLMIWAGLGFLFLAGILQDHIKKKHGLTYIKLIALFLVLQNLFINLPKNFRKNDNYAYNYAYTILNSLEKDAILFTYTDLDTGAIAYLNLIEKVRPDITLYNSQGLIFSNRLHEPDAVSEEEWQSIYHDFAAQSARPVYFIGKAPELSGKIGYGVYVKIADYLGEGEFQLVRNKIIEDYLERSLAPGEPFDHIERLLFFENEFNYCKIQAIFAYGEVYRFNSEPVEPARYCENYYGSLAYLDVFVDVGILDKDRLGKLIANAKNNIAKATIKADQASLFVQLVEIEIENGNMERANDYFQRGLDIWPSAENPLLERAVEVK